MYQDDLKAHLSELADHYAESLRLGRLSPSQIENAINYASRAAEQAGEMLAFEDAARFYQMAIRASDMQSTHDRRRRCELLLRLADAWFRAGSFEQSRRTFERVMELAKSLGAADEVGRLRGREGVTEAEDCSVSVRVAGRDGKHPGDPVPPVGTPEILRPRLNFSCIAFDQILISNARSF